VAFEDDDPFVNGRSSRKAKAVEEAKDREIEQLKAKLTRK
jgi:hypothetical protein